jgi:hypothetical protein
MEFGSLVDMEEVMDMDLATLYTVPDVEYPLITNGRVMLTQSGDVRRTSIRYEYTPTFPHYFNFVFSETSVVFVDDNAPPAQDYFINTEQHTYNHTSSYTFQNDKINATYYNGFELGSGGVVGALKQLHLRDK